ncbi:MAG: hypothetical protein ACXQTM_02155, partial [Methanosarcinales archaeon]
MKRFIRILDDRIIKTSEFYGIGFIITIRRLLTQGLLTQGLLTQGLLTQGLLTQEMKHGLLTQEMKHMRWGKKNSKIRETGSNITRRWSDVENSTS